MSKALRNFKKLVDSENQAAKIWQQHSAGSRVLPAKNTTNDAKYQLRLDAGETKNGKKRIYLQVNSKATNEKLKKFVKKNTSHAVLASIDVDASEPVNKQKAAFEAAWEALEGQALDNLK
ncbi:hypothetical protein PMZ80_003075 [Knufia obscura]|uniref:Uncharacterized protein n=1 Tax=Knufia obscura TaxID=1635080 RepID=A0ABR0RUR3_9EURO|nr:hypothetical protein LTS08_008816 [Lithohypha guttulata]KAK5943794.1 hypothetical protein PMZ80_003075 [Knufia obscura]